MDNNDLDNIAVSVIKERSKDIYDDGLKPATQEAGEALQALVGLFNNVVLYPVKKANINYKYKLEQFEEDLKNKIDSIPEDKIVEPPLRITGPTLEALKYTFDTEELRELYLELLASAMNADKANDTHTSYVEIIKALSPTDALIFKKFVGEGTQLATGAITIGFGTKVITSALPNFYVPELNEGIDPFEVSKSLQNLIRLGLLTYIDNTINNFNYDAFREHEFVQSRLHKCQLEWPNQELTIDIIGQVIIVNDFGNAFKRACIIDI